jgi:PAS domain S-box-containing protein
LNFQPLTAEELVIRLAKIVDSYEDAIIGRDVDGTINTWNTAATRLFGYTPDEILGESTLLLVPPDMHADELANQERVRGGERIDYYHAQWLRKGGQRLDLSFSVSPIKDSSGQVIGSAIMAREVGARGQDEAARARLAAIVEFSDDAIVAKDLNGVVTDWNQAAERMFGYSAEEIIGRSILTIIPPELQHEEPGILAKIRAGERVEHYETERVHKSGRRLEVSLTMSPIRDSFGRVIGASKIARDISERRKLEDARLILAAIVESSDDAIISKNMDGIITSWNAAAERLFGYKAEEIIGQSVLRLIPRELHYEEPRIIAKLRSGERIEHLETRRIKKNGAMFDVSLTISPIKDERGRIIGGSKILRDISDRKAAEAALVERERLAAAGRLAATLAHEVNNPLEAITNLAFLLSKNDSLDPESRHNAELLLNEVQRAGDVTRRTLGYYRDLKGPVDVDLQEIIGHVVHGKRKKLQQKNVTVHVEFQHLPPLRGFPGELRQVFDNLIENALDAVPENGHIDVHGREQFNNENSYVAVTVSDDGPGIPSEILPRIFEPFFTTKAEKGSGLGLWISQSILQKHGGNIYVSNDQDRWGTVFTVELPVSASIRSNDPAPARLSSKTASV